MGRFLDPEPKSYKGRFLDEVTEPIQSASVSESKKPIVVNPLEMGIKMATDPILGTFGADSRTRQTQKNYDAERNRFLESDTPIIGKLARQSFSDKPTPINVPIAVKVPNPVVGMTAEAISKNVSPRNIARESQGALLDTAANLGTDLALAKGPRFSANALKALSGTAEAAGGRFLNFYIKPRAAGFKFGKIPGRAVAKHIGPTLNRENLLEKVISKKQELLNSLESNISTAGKSGVLVDAGPIFEELQNSVNMMSAFPDTYSTQIKAHGDLAKDILRLAFESGAKGEGNKLLVSPQTAIKIKRALGELPSWNVQDPKLGSVSRTAKKAYGRFDKEIDAAVPGTAETNRDISELIGAQQGIELGAQREQGRSPVGLIDLAFGGLGAAGGPVGMAKGIALSKTLRSAPFNTTVGAAAGAIAKGGKKAAAAIEPFERPSLMQDAIKAMKQARLTKELVPEPEMASYSAPGRTIGRNKASEVRRSLPNFSSSGETIIPEGRGAILMPEVLESDLSRMAGEYGIPTYAPPRQVIKDFPAVGRGSAKESFRDLTKKERDLMNRVMERRNRNFKD